MTNIPRECSPSCAWIGDFFSGRIVCKFRRFMQILMTFLGKIHRNPSSFACFGLLSANDDGLLWIFPRIVIRIRMNLRNSLYLEGKEQKFRSEFPFFAREKWPKFRRKRDLYEPLLTAMAQVLSSLIYNAPAKKKGANLNSNTITHKMITELIPKQFRFGNSSTQITESNSQNNSGRDSVILCSHFLPRPGNSRNNSVR